MELIVIEVLLWAALIFFFWALKDNLGRVESYIEDFGLVPMRSPEQDAAVRGYDRADKVWEQIGRYCDAPIFQFAVIGDRCYRFDRVTPDGPSSAREDECCLAPGLIYVADPNGTAVPRS